MVAIVSNYLSPMWQGAKNIARFSVDQKQFDVFSAELAKRAEGKGLNGFVKNATAAWDESKKAIEGTSFFKNTWESLKGILPDCKAAFKEGGFLKGLKGSGGVLWNKMPLIGNAIALVMEVPNAYRAFTDKDGGFFTGVAEIGKAAVKWGAFALGCGVGTALGGPIAGMAFGMGANWVASKVVGKSFTEQQKESKHNSGNLKTPQAQIQPQGFVPQSGVPNLPNVPNYATGVFPQTAGNVINPFGYNQFPPNPMMDNIFGRNAMDEDILAQGIDYSKLFQGN